MVARWRVIETLSMILEIIILTVELPTHIDWKTGIEPADSAFADCLRFGRPACPSNYTTSRNLSGIWISTPQPSHWQCDALTT